MGIFSFVISYYMIVTIANIQWATKWEEKEILEHR